VLALMDKSFVKTWRLYLAGSIAAFNVGELQLFQVVFSRARNNQVPWSRKHLYVDKPAEAGKQRERSTAEA
jgi:cyclopropane-fatty-acyl-phospholipid synthase